MGVGPAAAEVAVVTGAGVQGACVQRYAAAAMWVQQQAACMCGATGSGGRGHDCNGWQAASVHAGGCGVRATVCSGGGVCATACSSSGVCVAVGRSGQQQDCNGRQ